MSDPFKCVECGVNDVEHEDNMCEECFEEYGYEEDEEENEE